MVVATKMFVSEENQNLEIDVTSEDEIDRQYFETNLKFVLSEIM